MPGKNVHLVCSSGGVKCFSYIGAVKCLIENGFEIKTVSASSMGSFIGLLICSGIDIAELEKKILNLDLKRYVRKRFWLKEAALLRYPFALFKTPDFENILTKMLGKNPNLGELKIPYFTLSLDLRQSQLLTFSSLTHPQLSCATLLTMATAIPPAYKPYEFDKRLLVDASVVTESPVWVAANQSKGEPVVVLKAAKPVNEKYLTSAKRFISQMVVAAAASNDKFSLNQISNATTVEINCGDIDAEDFDISSTQIEKLILQGYEAMEKTLQDVNNDFKNKLEIENLSATYKPADDIEKAEFNTIHVAEKFVKQTAAERNLVFVSYSSRDKNWFDKIQTFLRPLENFNKIKVWDDKDILPGEQWHEAIQSALAATKVALCIVTQNFLDSKFISDEELGYFIKISKQENVPIFWIAASSSVYAQTPLKEIQAANNPARPLDTLSEADLNKELSDICNKLVDAINR